MLARLPFRHRRVSGRRKSIRSPCSLEIARKTLEFGVNSVGLHAIADSPCDEQRLPGRLDQLHAELGSLTTGRRATGEPLEGVSLAVAAPGADPVRAHDP